MLRRDMRRLMAEHGGKLVVIGNGLEQARIDPDLIAGKNKSIGRLVFEDGIFPRLLAATSGTDDLLSDATHTAV